MLFGKKTDLGHLLHPVQDELCLYILLQFDPELEPKLQILAPGPAKSFGSLRLQLWPRNTGC